METNKELITDAQIEQAALKHVAPLFGKFGAGGDYKLTEQFSRLKAFTAELFALSQRSEAVPDVSWEDGFHNLLFALKVIAGAPSTCDDPVKAAQMFSTMPWVEALEALGIHQPAPTPSAAAGEQVLQCHPDITKRIRSIVDLLGLQSDMPEEDITGYEWAVLGLVRSEIARLKAATQPTPAQGDAVPVATKCAACNGEGWVRDIHDMEQGRIRCTKCATRQSSADAVDAALELAVSAIYFDDGSKYEGALWNIVWALSPSILELLHADPRAAFYAVKSDIAAQGGKGEKA